MALTQIYVSEAVARSRGYGCLIQYKEPPVLRTPSSRLLYCLRFGCWRALPQPSTLY